MGMTNNTLNKENTQKKILIATIISFAFFIGYDFLYLQPQQELAKQTQQKEAQALKQQSEQTPLVSQIAGEANSSAANNAPSVHANNANEIISTIKTKTSNIEIDSFGRIAQITLTTHRFQNEQHNAIKLFTPSQLKPLEVRFFDAKVNEEAFKIKAQQVQKFLMLAQNLLN